MSMTNKAKSNITPTQIAKGIGATWGDIIASWGDSFYGWGEYEIYTNKSKTSVTATNKPKVNA